jgi:uncharacterized protein
MQFKRIFIPLIVLCCLLAACSTQTASTTAPTSTQAVSATLEVITPSPQPAATPLPSSEDPLISAAQDFIAELQQGDYEAGFARFDDTMKAALPEDKLAELWGQLLDQVGEYQEQVGVRSESQEGYQIIILTTRFAKALLDVRVVFDSQGRIAGLFFAPAQQGEAQPYTPPDYVDEEAFTEVEVEIGSGEWALPGTLTLPKGDGPFPAMVLVHGSGPNDRDETIGPNKPFRDLAWGLAMRGIAVLRYDKRTLTHAARYNGETLANLTLQGETIDDALLAAQFLHETEKIDPERIYILGHSLGALAAPRIGEQDPDLAGLVLLAGPSRPLEDVVLDQYNYLYEIQGFPAGGKEEVDALATRVARVKDADLSETTSPEDLPLGLTPAYWLYLRGYDPIATAQALAMPMLILQGERDYQVLAEKDFAGWQEALQGRSGVTFKLYPDLNHLFMTGEGKSTPDEYNQLGHVSQEVIEDIARWVLTSLTSRQQGKAL